MSKIIKLELWNDPGYTEGCTDMPRVGASISNPDFTFIGPFAPSRSSFFNKVKLPEDYVALMSASYLRVTYEMNNNTSDIVLYGWIDDVSLVSDTEDAPLTEISWHIDYWRTYSGQAVFGCGHIKMRNADVITTVPPQQFPFRYYTVEKSSTKALIPINNGVWWVIMTVVIDSTESGTTTIETRAFPVSVTSPAMRISNGKYTCPSLNDIATGSWDEHMGLTPSNVVSCFMSPEPPGSVTGTSVITLSGWSASGKESVEGSGYYIPDTAYNLTQEFSATLPSETYTTDLFSYEVTGFDGECIGYLPINMSVKDYTHRLIISSNACYVQVRFNGIDSRAEGTCFTIPCLTVDITSNSWSEYAYSGQRQNDIDARNLESKSTAVNGVASTATTAASGALTGALAGAMLGMVGGPLGAVAGAVLGGAGSLLSTGVSYATDMSWKNNATQKVEDMAHSAQSDNLLMGGSGYDSLFNGRTVSLVKRVPDSYSLALYQNQRDIFGYSVSEPEEHTSYLINGGGPMKIDNLVVTGAIPSQAKEYIRNLFSKGVRLI